MSHEMLRQVRRFVVIGSISVGIDFVVYRALGGAGLGVHAAKGLSYLAGMAFGFVGNKLWTFESRRRSVAEPISYALLYAVTFVINVACNAGALAVLGTAPPLREHGAVVAFLVATGVTTVLNFLGLRFITFDRGIREGRLEAHEDAAGS